MGVPLEPESLRTADEPERVVDPERTTLEPDELPRLVALLLTAVRIASRFLCSDSEDPEERSVRTPRSDCLPCIAVDLPVRDRSPAREALLNPVLRGP